MHRTLYILKEMEALQVLSSLRGQAWKLRRLSSPAYSQDMWVLPLPSTGRKFPRYSALSPAKTPAFPSPAGPPGARAAPSPWQRAGEAVGEVALPGDALHQRSGRCDPPSPARRLPLGFQQPLPASLAGKQTCGKVNTFITQISSAPF